MSANTIVIYHNANCSKSRQALAYLRETDLDITVIDYLTNPPSVEELQQLIHLSGLPISAFIRENESVYQSLSDADKNDETALLATMVAHPVIIQRPIVRFEEKVMIARPPERVLTLLPNSPKSA